MSLEMTDDQKMLMAGRLQQLIDGVGGRDAAAEIIGIDPKTLTSWKSDPDKIRLTKIALLVRAAGTNMEFLNVIEPGLLEVWPTANSDEDRKSALSRMSKHTEASSTVLVPHYDAQLSAGSGGAVERVQVTSLLPFSSDILGKLGRSNADDFGAFSVFGDSMEPTAVDGGLVVVDMREQRVTSGIYAFGLDGEARIKRLHKRVDGVLEIISDNPAYDKETVSGDDLNRITIVGKVRLIMNWV